ncbi:MAG: hypothetical protein K6F87_08600 [Lachnospiraceae bacterium]|nr:hypothetical protein [Lachnospiraceae bacterium]
MIRELFYELYSGYRQIVGDGAVMVLFAASLLVLLMIRRENDRGCAGALLSPLSVIGCAAAGFTGKIKKPLALIFAVALCFLSVTVSGKNIIYDNIGRRAENDVHIPQDVITSMDAVLSDSDDPKVLTMPGWGLYFESYSSKFQLMYEEPRNGDTASLNEDERTAYMQLGNIHPEMKKVAAAAHRSGCGYIVMSNDIWPDVPPTACGYKVLCETPSCTVYREVTTP